MDFHDSFRSAGSLQIRFQGQTFQFQDLCRIADHVESDLSRCGVKSGQMVVLCHSNHVLHLVLFWVCARMGLIFVPLFESLHEAEKKNHLQKLQVEWVFEIRQGSWQLQRVHNPSQRLDRSGCLFQTSGTTGEPGYILQSFSNMSANARIAANGQGITSSSRLLSVLSFSHVGGLCMQTTAFLLQGGTIQIQNRNELQRFVDHLEKATHTIVVPSYLKLLQEMASFRDHTFSHQPLVITGSTVVSPDTFQQLQAKSFRVQSVYGLTEIGPYVSVAHSSPVPPPGCLSDLGLLNPGYERRVNPETQEIQLRGPCLGEKFQAGERRFESLTGEDGFFSTGDLALEAEGTVYFKGRKKNIITVGGFKVNPMEVEEVLLRFPGVRNCAVVARNHYLLGEMVMAYVVGDSSRQVELQEYLKDNLSSHKRPRKIEYVEILPETSIGKNNLRQIRKKAQNG